MKILFTLIVLFFSLFTFSKEYKSNSHLEDENLEEGNVTAREKVTDYLQKNPGSFWMEVNKATGVKKQAIYEIANETNLKLRKFRGSQSFDEEKVELAEVILDFIIDNKTSTSKKISKKIKISERLTEKNIKILVRDNKVYEKNGNIYSTG